MSQHVSCWNAADRDRYRERASVRISEDENDASRKKHWLEQKRRDSQSARQSGTSELFIAPSLRESPEDRDRVMDKTVRFSLSPVKYLVKQKERPCNSPMHDRSAKSPLFQDRQRQDTPFARKRDAQALRSRSVSPSCERYAGRVRDSTSPVCSRRVQDQSSPITHRSQSSFRGRSIDAPSKQTCRSTTLTHDASERQSILVGHSRIHQEEDHPSDERRESSLVRGLCSESKPTSREDHNTNEDVEQRSAINISAGVYKPRDSNSKYADVLVTTDYSNDEWISLLDNDDEDDYIDVPQTTKKPSA